MRVKFGDVVKDVKENVDRAKNPYEFYVAGDHMDSEDFRIHRRGKFATDDVGPAFVRIFRPGQVLYGSRRTYLKKVCVADFEGVCANTTFVLETKDKDVLSQKLLPFLMLSEGFTDWSVKHSKGSTNPYVLFSDLADYEFDLPPLDRQRELAELLWAANDLKEKYKKLITASDEMLKAKFREMFGAMRSAECGMRNVKLGSVCDILNGFAFQSKKYVDKGTRIIRIANVQKGFIEDKTPAFYSDNDMIGLDRYKLFEDDLLMSLTGNVGRVGLVNEELLPAALNQRVACLRISAPELLDKEFLFIQLNQESFESKCIESASGSAQKNMSTEWLKECELILPPLDLQRQFVEIAAQEEKVKANLKKSIADVDNIIKGLINQ